ncbi:hypothetical protein RUM44_010470 [Polyplax serrata]|uniref:Uncharacterized protein n=1 Tax=Polyplax serrata TaxID=468196 RepID=A0ABR1AVM7_POLSC
MKKNCGPDEKVADYREQQRNPHRERMVDDCYTPGSSLKFRFFSGDKYETVFMDNGYNKYMTLKIRGVTKSDFVSYRCVAKNSLGETDGLIKLDGARAPGHPTGAPCRLGTSPQAAATEAAAVRESTFTWPAQKVEYVYRSGRVTQQLKLPDVEDAGVRRTL